MNIEIRILNVPKHWNKHDLIHFVTHKAFKSGLGLDAMSLAWPTVVQLVVSFNSGLQWRITLFLCFVTVIELMILCFHWDALIELESHYANIVCIFCIKNFVGTQCEVCTVKDLYPPPHTHTPAVVYILLTVLRRWSRCCSYSMYLCSLHYDALHVWSCPANCLCVSSVRLAFWSPCLGRRELVLSCICLLTMHTLICATFSLPPDVMGWLRLLLVALPGLFCLPIWTTRFPIQIFHVGSCGPPYNSHCSFLFENNTVSVKAYIFRLSLLHINLSEKFSNSFIEKIFLKCKIGREKSTNFKATKLCCVYPFLVICTFFVPNVAQSILFSKQFSLFDARDNNKSNQPISIRVRSDLRQRQHFFSVVQFTPLVCTTQWKCISHYISWTKLLKETNFVWY